MTMRAALAALGVLMAAPASSGDDADARAAIDAFFERYYGAFSGDDCERIAREMVRAPAVMATPDGVLTLSDEASVLATYQKIRGDLAADGYSHSELLESHISVLGPTTALVATRFRRVRGDGSVIVEAGATYTLVYEGQWRIASAMVHPGDRLVSLR